MLTKVHHKLVSPILMTVGNSKIKRGKSEEETVLERFQATTGDPKVFQYVIILNTIKA